MSSTAQIPVETQKTEWAMYRALVGIGILSALVIAVTFHLTEPRIRQNKQEALEKAIFAVLPDARSKVAFRFNEQGRFEKIDGKQENKERIYATYDANSQLLGFAIEARGMGYQDFIDLLYAYRPAEKALTGFTVLDSRETPGLGNKIATDKDFLRNFERLDVSLAADRKTIAHPIETVRHGRAIDPWQIDGISGATVSSKAVGAILRQSTTRWIPKIAQHLREFEIEHTRHRN
ncbi:MAG: FMN-binding protein [Gammaproteobacteria bacterium]